MHGMLSFLPCAGALGVDLDALMNNKWTVAVVQGLTMRRLLRHYGIAERR
jgi:hypothetical protein